MCISLLTLSICSWMLFIFSISALSILITVVIPASLPFLTLVLIFIRSLLFTLSLQQFVNNNSAFPALALVPAEVSALLNCFIRHICLSNFGTAVFPMTSLLWSKKSTVVDFSVVQLFYLLLGQSDNFCSPCLPGCKLEISECYPPKQNSISINNNSTLPPTPSPW